MSHKNIGWFVIECDYFIDTGKCDGKSISSHDFFTKWEGFLLTIPEIAKIIDHLKIGVCTKVQLKNLLHLVVEYVWSQENRDKIVFGAYVVAPANNDNDQKMIPVNGNKIYVVNEEGEENLFCGEDFSGGVLEEYDLLALVSFWKENHKQP
ncbi:MAG: hypothetical protein LC122_13695 [Chitinophagales bacterium]|nr:hypothetical protein [Chitinophagales bacterium]